MERDQVPSRKTEWGVIEREINGKNSEAARGKILNDDWAFATSHSLRIYLSWDTGGDELTGPQETAAYRAIAAQGATPEN
jgi:hypothetical protein